MPNFVFANNVSTTLSAPLAPTDTTVTLASAAHLPSLPVGSYWALTLNDEATQSVFEIVYVSAISGTTLTVLRGQEGTSAQSWLVGDFAFGAVTAGELNNFLSVGSSGDFVLLSPGSAQSGSIDITGGIDAGGDSAFLGVTVTNGVQAETVAVAATLSVGDQLSVFTPYANTPITSLPILFHGSANWVGIGPSSGLSAQGVTASTLAIAQAGSANIFAFDAAGNLGMMGDLWAAGIYQNAQQVVDTITSSDGTIISAKSGNVVSLRVGNIAPSNISQIVPRRQMRPTSGNSYQTLTLPVLPGGATQNYQVYACASCDTSAGGSQVLSGAGATWEAASITVPDDNTNGPEPIDYIGTAVGGDQPSVTYQIVGGLGSTNYVGVFALIAYPV